MTTAEILAHLPAVLEAFGNKGFDAISIYGGGLRLLVWKEREDAGAFQIVAENEGYKLSDEAGDEEAEMRKTFATERGEFTTLIRII